MQYIPTLMITKLSVCCDGDDYLSFNGVLERLEKEYKDPDVWMTYGRFIVIQLVNFGNAAGAFPKKLHNSVPSEKDGGMFLLTLKPLEQNCSRR